MSRLRCPWQGTLFDAAIAISALCLLSTYLLPDLAPETSREVKRTIALASYGLENNFGAWWSSMLLLTASLLAYDAGAHARIGRHLSAARAWTALALVLLIFSIDEGASIHERVDRGIGRGSAVFGAILGALLLFAFIHLWRDRAYRRHAVWLGCAVVLLGTVPIHERLELTGVQFAPTRGVRVFLEEGTEIVAILMLLWTVIRAPTRDASMSADQNPAAFVVLNRWPRQLLWAGVLLALPVAFISATLPDQVRGRPASWMAAALALLAAFTAVEKIVNAGAGPKRRHALLAVLAALISLEAFTFDLAISVRRRAVFAVTLLLFAMLYSFWPRRSERTVAGFELPLFALVLAIAAFFTTQLAILNAVIIAAGLAIWFAAVSAELEARLTWRFPAIKRRA